MTNVIKQLVGLIAKSERLSFFKLLVVICIVAIFDSFGVFSIMPFIALVSNPQIISENEYAQLIYSTFNISSINQFLVVAGTSVFFLLIFSLVLKSASLFYQFKFSYRQEHLLSSKLFERYLSKSYEWHAQNNGSELSRQILSEISVVVHQGIMPAIFLIAQVFNVIFIALVLMLVDLQSTVILSVTTFCLYGLILLIFSKRLKKHANERLQFNSIRFKMVNEAFPALRELKIYRVEDYFLNQFSKSTDGYSTSLTMLQTIGQLPRFVLEGAAFGGLVLFIVIMIVNGREIAELLPILSLYIFAGYRLMPAAQQIYNSVSLLRFIAPSLEKIHADYSELSPQRIIDEKQPEFRSPLSSPPSIRIIGLSYGYPNTSIPAINNISTNIEAGDIVAIIGPSGSGKSTLVDLLAGLLEPSKGQILYEVSCSSSDTSSKSTYRVGYVPQEIYLTDTSIKSNIAFGEMANEIDFDRVVQSAKMVGIHDFIVNSLDQNYETMVGEAGARLSGGQRQRIGIARALYQQPSVLIFDEATSALDIAMEKELLKTITKLKQKVTIIIIAHSIETMKKIDNIIMIERGSLVIQGSFKDLIKTNDTVKQFILSE